MPGIRMLALTIAVAVLLMGNGVRVGGAGSDASWRQAPQSEVAAVVERGSVLAHALIDGDWSDPNRGLVLDFASLLKRYRVRPDVCPHVAVAVQPNGDEGGWAERERGPPNTTS